MWTRETFCSIVVVGVLGLAVVAASRVAIASTTEAEEAAGRLKRLAAFVRSYAVSQGMNMMISDDDVKCIMSLGELLRSDDKTNALMQPVNALWALVMKTTPACKLNLISKSRMFLRPDFSKKVVAILLNQRVKKR